MNDNRRSASRGQPGRTLKANEERHALRSRQQRDRPSAEDLVTPQYIVLFRRTGPQDENYKQVIPFDEILAQADRGCLPYGLDADLLPILPALWYCLQLPRSRFDFLDLPPESVRRVQHLDFAQRIVIAPVQYAGELRELLDSGAPKIAFAHQEELEATRGALSLIDRLVAAEAIAELSDRTLAAHWSGIAHSYGVETPHDWTPKLIPDSAIPSVASPLVFLSRLLPRDPATPSVHDFLRGADNHLRRSLEVQAHLHMLEGRSQSDPTAPEDDALLAEQARDSWHRFTCPVAIAVPGVSPGYMRSIAASDESDDRAKKVCNEAQESIIRFLPAHRAVGRGHALL